MSDPNTITIPADLNGEWTGPQMLRDYAGACLSEPGKGGAAAILRWLADEIERQAPRPEGWYHVKDSNGERVLWWYGTGWSYYADRGDKTSADDDATITPVTIGDPS